MADTTFSIDLAVSGGGSVAALSSQVDQLAERMKAATAASAQAADAVKAGEAAYKQSETAYDRAAKALERVKIAMNGASGDKLVALQQKQLAAAQAAEVAKTALTAEAAALDKLKASAAAATASEQKIADAQKSTQKALNEKTAAQRTAIQEDRILASGFGRLGGPLGSVGQKAFALKGVWDKMSKTFGDAAPFVAGAVGLTVLAAAAVAAVAAVGAAIAIGMAKVELWAITLADKTDQLGAIQKKFGDNVKKIFGGLKIDGLLKQLSALADLFNVNTASGRAIKVVFESIFQPLTDAATGLVPKIRVALLQFELATLKTLNFVKDKWNEWHVQIHAIIEAIKPLGPVLKTGFEIFVGTMVVVVALFAALAVAIGVTIGKSIQLGQELFSSFISGLIIIKNFLQNFSLAEIGTQIIKGLADGITNGAGAVVDAVKNAATNAVNAAKKTLGIASPSKVFAEIGMHTGAGMQQGVEASSDGVQGSLENMVSPPSQGAAPAAGSSSSDNSSTFYITINAAGSDGASIAAALTSALENLGAQLGTKGPVAA